MNYPSDQSYYSYDQYHQGYQQRPYQQIVGQQNGHLSNIRPQGGSSDIYPQNEPIDNNTGGSQGQQKLNNGTSTLSIYNTQSGNNRRGFWSPEEDRRLMELISIFGASNWVKISNSLSTRTPKQCRERYHQNLKPSLNRTPISAEEGELIEQLVAKHGKKWAEIARHLNGRSDNAVKNWWNGGANRKRRATVQMKSSPEELLSTISSNPQDLVDQKNEQPLPQPLPQPHPPQQISFKTSMFGNQEAANTPPLSSTSSTNSTSPYRTSNQRLASLDVDNVSNLIHHHNMHASTSHSAGSNISHPNGNQSIVLPPLNNVNNSLPSLILPSKKRLLDEHNPISRRHSYANTLYSVHSQNTHTNNITNSNPNLSNLMNASNQPNSLNTSGQSSPYHGSPLMLSNQASRNNSISIPNFEFSALNTSNATSLTESRRSSYNPDFFPNPLKENVQTSHKRNISQNSFNSPLTPSYRHSVSGSASNTTTNTNSGCNSNPNSNINTGNTTNSSMDQHNSSPKNVKPNNSTGTCSKVKRQTEQDKIHLGSDKMDETQDIRENSEATDNTKISVSSLLD
mmetsp:Transcript_5721/g.6841  ORF Transcript_5721/g.6841 Transcript_5721/m.6841 type:complete len:568 (-) Transcript_5721:1463-3166(-)